MSERLFIAGGSARAAAQSAVRAGFQVTAADLFCDLDLTAICPAYSVPDFPRGILRVAQELSPRHWLYTGGLENEPALVDAISAHHHLLGQPGDVLRQIRDPWYLWNVLTRGGLRCPRPERRAADIPAGRYLCKPLKGCGGTRIQMCDRPDSTGATEQGQAHISAAAQDASHEDVYYQPWIRGPSYGAIFLARPGEAVLLGVSRQLIGCVWAGASGFRYVGSIGPVCCETGTERTLRRVGSCLADAYPLRGLFGIDMIIADADVWTVEVNPRYTASVEVLERATGAKAMQLHWEACQDARLPGTRTQTEVRPHGKAVVFAQVARTIDTAFHQRLDAIRSRAPGCEFADLPPVGTPIRVGQPILTVLTHGAHPDEVHRQLRLLAREVHAAFAG